MGLLGNLFARIGSGAMPYLLPLLLQLSIGYSPAQAGLLMLPLNFYKGYWREHGYGMSTQDQADWWLDWAVGLGVEVVGTMLAVALLYAVFRRAGERWWLWGAAACSVLLAAPALAGARDSRASRKWPTPERLG